MKTIHRLSFVAILLLLSAGMRAADHLKLVDGDFCMLFQKDKSVKVTFSYDDLKIENQSFEHYCKGREKGYAEIFQAEKQAAEKAFKAKWRKVMVKGLTIADQSAADYSLRIQIHELDLGSNAAGIWGIRTADGGALMWGTLTLVDRSGRAVLDVTIDGLRGLGNNGIIFYKEGNRLKKVYEKLAIKLCEKD
ncbi:MAG: hypothetical protein MR450_08395 [Prevotella sp.]|nr:hypothetical protein [Prevotella sp.]MDY4040256.1 hypothetical protein [Prevotella sp.]